MDFAGFPKDIHLDTHYAEMGALFVDPYNYTDQTTSYLNDGFGLATPWDIDIAFDRSLHWIGLDFPGLAQLELYQDETLLYTSRLLGSPGTGHFAGLVAEKPFNRVVIYDPSGDAHIDDIFFGPPPCLADVNLDGKVNVDDLVAVITGWGCNQEAGTTTCAELDVTRDGAVDVDDLVAVILNWGACPQ